MRRTRQKVAFGKSSQSARILAAIENLETRRLLAAVFPTAVEQYVVQVINRARANPTAEVQRLSGLTWAGTPGLNEGLPAGTISPDAKQPLAINPFLTDGVRKHSQWMFDTNIFSHSETSAELKTAVERARVAGYPGTNWVGENISAWGASANFPANFTEIALNAMNGLFIDRSSAARGHRTALMDTFHNEVGIGTVDGVNADGKKWYMTQNFSNQGLRYVTGAIYSDGDRDNFYTPGEGLGGVTITATRAADNAVFTTTTWDAGGYSLVLTPGSYSVVATGGNVGTQAARTITIVDRSVQADFIGNNAPVITTQPTDQAADLNATATFTIAATGLPAPTFQWQIKTPTAADFTNIDGETNATLTVNATAITDGNQYRAVATNSSGNVNSSVATLTISALPPVIVTQPTDVTVNLNDTATFTVAVTGKPAPNIQWQVKTLGSEIFREVAGGQGATFNVAAAESNNGSQYRAFIDNVMGNVTTNPVTLNISGIPLVFTNGPEAQSVKANETALFSITATGFTAVQWAVSTDGGTTFIDLAGETHPNLSFVANAAQNGNIYRVTISSPTAGFQFRQVGLTVTAVAAAAVKPSVIDLFMGYTATARAAVGSQELIVDKINRSVALLNETLANSKVCASVRLVGTIETDYAESGNGDTDSARLVNPTDGFMDDVTTQANTFGADVTNVVVSAADASVTAGNFSTIVLPFLNNGVLNHEFGHVLGGGHAHSATENGTHQVPYSFESALQFGNQTYGGAISGNLNYYSNPNVLFRGVPTGVAGAGADAADNARIMNDNAAAVAASKTTTTPDTQGPIVGLGSVRSGDVPVFFTFTVRYLDGSGVNVESLGDNDILVTGPNGFSSLAKLVSIDDPSVSYGYHLATYSVSTNGVAGDLSQYSFSIQANGVTDTLGNAAPAGALGGASPLLPDYAGSDPAHAADIGDLFGRRWTATDEVGPKYQGVFLDPAIYRFSLSDTSSLGVGLVKPNSAGGQVVAFLYRDANNNLQLDQNEEIQPTSVDQYADLPADDNYYLLVNPWQPGTIPFGNFNLSVSASGALDNLPAPASLSGVVYTDANTDGIKNADEAGLASVPVQLTGLNDLGQNVNTFAYTDANGLYKFDNLRPSSATGYTLTEVMPPGALQGKNALGSLNGTLTADNVTSGIVVTAGAAGSGYLFGTRVATGLASLSGSVFLDSNNNGVKDAGETGLPNIAVSMNGTKRDGTDLSVPTVLTDADGNYTFAGLNPSDTNGYTIAIAQPTDFLSGQMTGGTLGGFTQFIPNNILGIVVNGISGTGYNFGLLPIPADAPPAPPATDQTLTVDQNAQGATGNVIDLPQARSLSLVSGAAADPTDPDPVTRITAQLVTPPIHAASFVLNPNGSYIYRPTPDYHGSDSFTFRLINSSGRTAVAKVTIDVQHVIQAPRLNAEAARVFTTDQTRDLRVNLLGLNYDVQSLPLSFKIGKIIGGTAWMMSDGKTLRFRPASDFKGNASITYVCSNGDASTTFTLKVRVLGVEREPTTSDSAVTTLPSTAVNVKVLDSVQSLSGVGVRLRAVDRASHGLVSIDRRGTETAEDDQIIYRPNFGFHGTDSFTYRVANFRGLTTTGVVYIKILPGAGLGNDPTNYTRSALDIFGTRGNDYIKITKSGSAVRVTMNGTVLGEYEPTGLIAAFGDEGDDTIDASGVTQDVALFGEGDRDKLIGGAGRYLLAGGTGMDTLQGGSGAGYLISGTAEYESRGFLPIKSAFGGERYFGRYVRDDGAVDQVYGGSGHDTFWVTTRPIGTFDVLHGHERGEELIGPSN